MGTDDAFKSWVAVLILIIAVTIGYMIVTKFRNACVCTKKICEYVPAVEIGRSYYIKECRCVEFKCDTEKFN